MRKLTSSIFCILFAYANGADARAEVIDIDGAFHIVESDALYQLSLSPGGSFPARPRITGYIPVSFTFDTETLEVTELRIRDFGLITWDSFGFNISSNVFFDGVGTVPTIITANFVNLGMEVRGNGDTIGVDPLTGALNASDLSFLLNQGEASAGIEVGGDNFLETVRYNENPENAYLAGTPMLTVEKDRDDLFERQYHFSLNLSFSETSTEKIEGSNLSITTTENFKLVAKLIYQEETAFSRWHEFNKHIYDGDSLDSESAVGIPMYLAFALGHEHYQSDHQRPFRFYTSEGDTYFTVISPIRRDDVSIVFSSTLEDESWTPIPNAWLSNGSESLKEGSRRNLVVKLHRTLHPFFFESSRQHRSLPTNLPYSTS